MDISEIKDNLAEIESRITKACERARRSRSSVQLIAVSKSFPFDVVQMGIAAGLTVFGENRVQEAAEKFEKLKEGKFADASDSAGKRNQLHLIGHLQTNKAKRAAELFDMIQVVDRPEVAQKLDHHCEQLNRLLPVLVQVNLGNEETKSGVEPHTALEMVKRLSQFKHLRIRGLMAIPPFRENTEDSRVHFRSLKQLSDEIAQAQIPHVSMNELSMGMSHDYEIAIEEGATMVRLGTAIFGKRARKAAGDEVKAGG